MFILELLLQREESSVIFGTILAFYTLFVIFWSDDMLLLPYDDEHGHWR